MHYDVLVAHSLMSSAVDPSCRLMIEGAGGSGACLSATSQQKANDDAQRHSLDTIFINHHFS